MSFKTLHQFTVIIEKEVKDVSTRTENGKEITETTTAIRPINVTVLLKEPTRREKQDLSLFQSIAHNEAVNLGLLPRLVMIQKLSKDPANPISGDEDKTLASMHNRLQELANDYIRLNAQTATQTQEDKDRRERLLVEYAALQKKATDITTAYQSVFAHTAEQYAQNKVLTWLTLFLTFVKTGPDKYEPMFKGTDFKSKEEALGELEDTNDKIYLAAVQKLSTYWMLYFFGRASTPEEFTQVEEDWARQVEAEKKLREEAEKREKEELEKKVPDAAPTDVSPTITS